MIKKNKKSLFIDEAIRRFNKSRAIKRIKEREKGIINDVVFKNELEEIRRKHPTSGFNTKSQDSMAWEEFCKKWHISFFAMLHDNKVVSLAPIKIAIMKDYPIMVLLHKEVTDQDIQDYAPLLMEVKHHCFGERDKGKINPEIEKRNISIRKDYQSMKKQYSSGSALFNLKRKYKLQINTLKEIIYDKKVKKKK